MSTSESFEKAGECLYRNPSSGTYFAILKVRGKQIKKTLKTQSLPEARRKLKDFKASATQIDHRAARNTLAHYADVFIGEEEARPDKFSKNKLRAVRMIKESWPGGAGVPIPEVKASDIKSFMQTVGKDFGWSYYNFILAVVRNCFTGAFQDQAIMEIPGDRENKRLPESVWHRKRKKKPVRITPTVEQFRAIVKSIREQPFADTREESADFVEAQGLLGLGQAELANIKIKSISLQRNTIQILRIKTQTPFEIPIYPQAKGLIARRMKITGEDPEALVFSIRDAKVAVGTACKRLNFPKFSQRSFRRMFITEALQRGVNVKVIAELQGHQDGGKLILDTYSAIIGGTEKQSAGEKIALAFSGEGAA